MSIVAPDYKKQGVTVIPPELQYVEVIAVTADSGYDANQQNGKSNPSSEQADADEKELPATVTLLVTPEQSKILAELEANGTLHVSLVYRGSKENAAKFTEAQDSVLSKLYPEEMESQESEDASQPETPAKPPVESGAE